MNGQVNENLEAILGKLHLAEELCNSEVDKLYRGEESLTLVCSELECAVTPVAQKVAQYVSSSSTINSQILCNLPVQLLFEKCGCEGEECSYTPGQFIEPIGVFDVTQLFSTLYDSVHSLYELFSSISKVPLMGATSLCSNTPEEDTSPIRP